MSLSFPSLAKGYLRLRQRRQDPERIVFRVGEFVCGGWFPLFVLSSSVHEPKGLVRHHLSLFLSRETSSPTGIGRVSLRGSVQADYPFRPWGEFPLPRLFLTRNLRGNLLNLNSYVDESKGKGTGILTGVLLYPCPLFWYIIAYSSNPVRSTKCGH